MSLNWGNAFYPNGRLSNHHDFLSLSLLVLEKKNTWHSSTDNTEAYYLLHALQGSSETWKVQQGLSCWPGIMYWITDQHGLLNSMFLMNQG